MTIRKKVTAISIAVLVGVLFILTASIKLTSQGLNYDEIHQAPASFYHLDKIPTFYTYSYLSFPVLNMSYSAAIKSHVYGLYMRFSHRGFSAFSWRMTGILFTAIGLGVFVFLLVRRGKIMIALFGVLFVLSDATVLLTSRHDWGPTALALMLRLILLGIYLSQDDEHEFGRGVPFLMGAILGFSVFEKLSSIVLAVALVMMLIMDIRFRKPANFVSFFIGGFIGVLPLLLVNAASFCTTNKFISLSYTADPNKAAMSISGFIQFIKEYLALGNGDLASRYILDYRPVLQDGPEIVLISSLLIWTAFCSIKYWHTHPFFRTSLIMLFAYIGIGVSLYVLPQRTWVHHWIIGTPLQYAAFALALAGFFSTKTSPRFWPVSRTVFLALVILCVGGRLINMVGIEKALLQEKVSMHYDPSLTQLGEFAASKGPGSIFIIASWGFATPIYCLSGGNCLLPAELFWEYKDKKQINSILSPNHTDVYLIKGKDNIPKWPNLTYHVGSDLILSDFRTLPEWRETTPEPMTQRWPLCNVYKFQRR